MSSVPQDPAGGSGPDRPERRWDAGSRALDPDDPFLLERLGIVVPDDARELDPARIEVVPRRFASSGRPPLVAIAVTLALVLGTVGLASVLLGAVTPRATETTRPGSYALAEHPTALAGQVGGLLPDTGVRLDDALGLSARNLRPAVLFVAPEGSCATCAAALGAMTRQARDEGIRVYAVSSLDGVAATRALVKGSDAPTAHLLVDSAGTLRAAFAASAARAVLVHADGVIGAVLTDPSPTGQYGRALTSLRLPGAPPSLQQAPPTH